MKLKSRKCVSGCIGKQVGVSDGPWWGLWQAAACPPVVGIPVEAATPPPPPHCCLTVMFLFFFTQPVQEKVKSHVCISDI
jgi:hypothetical protein